MVFPKDLSEKDEIFVLVNRRHLIYKMLLNEGKLVLPPRPGVFWKHIICFLHLQRGWFGEHWAHPVPTPRKHNSSGGNQATTLLPFFPVLSQKEPKFPQKPLLTLKKHCCHGPRRSSSQAWAYVLPQEEKWSLTLDFGLLYPWDLTVG